MVGDLHGEVSSFEGPTCCDSSSCRPSCRWKLTCGSFPSTPSVWTSCLARGPKWGVIQQVEDMSIEDFACAIPLSKVSGHDVTEIVRCFAGAPQQVGTFERLNFIQKLNQNHLIKNRDSHVFAQSIYFYILHVRRLTTYLYIDIPKHLCIWSHLTFSGVAIWRFCHVDSSIRLDEWKLMGAFHHTDRPDGRARVQFGVIIGRALGDKSKVSYFFGLQESLRWAIFWLQKRV